MRGANGLLLILLIFTSCHNSERDVARPSAIADTRLQAEEKLANTYYENDEYGRALECFSKLIELDSTNGMYYFRRGYSFARLLNKKNAIQDYKQAVKYHFKEASCYKNIALEYSYENDSLAVLYYNKYLAIDPNDIDARIEIDRCKERLKRPPVPLPVSK